MNATKKEQDLYDAEDGSYKYEPPSTTSYPSLEAGIRMAFVRKVYAVLTIQLLVTIMLAAIPMFHQPTRQFMLQSPGLVMLAGILGLVLIFVLQCVRRVHPWNIVIVTLFTLCEAYVISACTLTVNAVAVGEAALMTLGIFLALTLYTCNSKRDFSGMGAGLFAALVGFLIATIIGIFISSSLMHTVLAAAGAILFSLFIVYDTDRILNRTDLDDWAGAAIELYLDVINLFINLLALLRDDR